MVLKIKHETNIRTTRRFRRNIRRLDRQRIRLLRRSTFNFGGSMADVSLIVNCFLGFVMIIVFLISHGHEIDEYQRQKEENRKKA